MCTMAMAQKTYLAGDDRVLMVSFFQHPFYPYSGDKEPASNMLNVPMPAYTKGMEVREMIEMMWIAAPGSVQARNDFCQCRF